MDTNADDLATLVEALDLRNVIHVGHSTGGGEVARYLGGHGTQKTWLMKICSRSSRVRSKAVLSSAQSWPAD
jgi:pimeloyl-ACP methyl ester carboxylesterase